MTRRQLLGGAAASLSAANVFAAFDRPLGVQIYTVRQLMPAKGAEALLKTHEVAFSGKATDAIGLPLANHCLLVTLADGKKRLVRTGAHGEYRVVNAPAGRTHVALMGASGGAAAPVAIGDIDVVHGPPFIINEYHYLLAYCR